MVNVQITATKKNIWTHLSSKLSNKYKLQFQKISCTFLSQNRKRLGNGIKPSSVIRVHVVGV